MRVDILVDVASAGKGAVLLTPQLCAALAEGHHVGPDLIDIGGVREVNHVGRVAASRTHVDFQRHEVALLAQSLAIAVQPEELQMHETVPDAEGFYGAPSQLPQSFGYLPVNIIREVEPEVDDVHDGRWPDGHRLEERIPLGIDDGIVTAYFARDEFLHDVVLVVAHRVEERLQLLVALNLMRSAGSYANVWLGDDGIARQPRKVSHSINLD